MSESCFGSFAFNVVKEVEETPLRAQKVYFGKNLDCLSECECERGISTDIYCCERDRERVCVFALDNQMQSSQTVLGAVS